MDHEWPADVAKRRRRMCRTRTGKRKARLSRAEALTEALRHRRAAYACPVCGFWHTGTIK